MDRSSNRSRNNWLKHRISQMLLNFSCTTTTTTGASHTKHSSSVSQEPVCYSGRYHQPHHRRHGRPASPFTSSDGQHVAPVVQIPVDCGGRQSTDTSWRRNFPLTKMGEKQKEEEDREQEKGTMGEMEGKRCPPALSSSRSNKYCNYFKEKKKDHSKRKKTKKRQPNSYGFSSSSSVDGNDELGFFSSEGEEEEEEEEDETETLFSSRSFSSDSSEFYRRPSSISKKKKSKKKKPTGRPCCTRRRIRPVKSSWDGDGWYRQQPVSTSWSSSKGKKEKAAQSVVEAAGGFAVVKQSTDPYVDFRGSILEMIMDWQIRDHQDLERLLFSYLSLNSRRHHPVILEAFADIWEAVFGA